MSTTPTTADWREPTAYLHRFGDALRLLCAGHQPTDAMMTAWLDHSSEELQEFCIEHGPVWAMGIGVVDAALTLADQPVEGPDHEYRESAPAPSEVDKIAIALMDQIECYDFENQAGGLQNCVPWLALRDHANGDQVAAGAIDPKGHSQRCADALAAPVPQAIDIDMLADEILRIDGYGAMSPSELAEGLMPFILRRKAQQPTPAASLAWRDEQNQSGVSRQVNDAGGIRSGVCAAQVMQPVEASPTHYNTTDNELSLLLELTDDMVTGNANMDTGMCWMQTLQGIQRRLAKSPDIDEAALSAAQPQVLSDAQIAGVWIPYDQGIGSRRDLITRILALQAAS